MQECLGTKKPSLKAVFFDMDGTLIDTEPSAARVINEQMSAWGFQLETSDAHAIVGRKWEYAFEFLFSKYRPPVPRAVAEKAMFQSYRKAIEQRLDVVKGAKEAVIALSKGYRLALVSGSSRHEILWAMNKLGLTSCFEVILGAEDYQASKPSPEGYLLALNKMGLSHCEAPAVVFEDSRAGVESAQAAKLPVIAIRSTNRFNQNTQMADGHIEDLSEVNEQWLAAWYDDYSKKRLASG